MKKRITIIMMMLLGIVMCACSKDVAENNIDTETEQSETVEETEVVAEETEEVIESTELPFYTYEEFVEVSGLSIEDYDLERMYKGYYNRVDMLGLTPTRAFAGIMEGKSNFYIKKENTTVADKQPSTNTGSSSSGSTSSGSSGGNYTGGSSSSTPTRTQEEKAAIREQLNSRDDGPSIQDYIDNGHENDWTEEDKAIAESLFGY